MNIKRDNLEFHTASYVGNWNDETEDAFTFFANPNFNNTVFTISSDHLSSDRIGLFRVKREKSSNLFYVRMDGNIGIGTNSPSQKLHVIGNVLANNVQVTSDRKLKKNIKDYNKGLAMVKNIHTVEYQMIAETDSVYVPSKLGKKEKKAPTYVGVIAQELQQIAPDLVHTYLDDAGEETLAIDYTALTFILINAVKEQQVLIEELQKKVLKK